MQAEIAKDGIVEAFAAEFRERWRELPNKGLFLVLLTAWLLLFMRLGVSTLGYLYTASLPQWMLNIYLNPNSDEVHGVLVPFLVLGLFWWKRHELLAIPPRTWWPALIGLALAALLHLAGYMVQQPRVSMVAMFAGIYCLIGLAWGPRWMARSFFPFVLFVFCIPLSSLPLFNDRITFPLRMLSAWIVDLVAHLGLAPDLKREGTQLFYQGATHQWNVDIAPACSGIRGLTALSLMTISYGMIVFREPWKRLVMILSAIPLAVMNNVLRISFAVLVGRFLGEDALKAVEQKAGFYTFLFIAIPLVMGTGWLLGDRWRAPAAAATSDETSTAAKGANESRRSPDSGVKGPASSALKRTVPLMVLGVGMILVSGLLLSWLQDHQRLGNPGVTTSPLPDAAAGSLQLKVEFPEWVSIYESEEREMDPIVVGALPADTSFGQRFYKAPDGLQIQVTGVLMGTDRTSIHKPQFCLVGAGWTIDKEEFTTVPVPEPRPYELPVSRITASRLIEYEGQPVKLSGVYVYWFVEEHEVTARHEERMMSMARSMITKGVLQRWAYISCFVQCMPGQEDWAFERIKRFMASGVPKFQIPAGQDEVAVAKLGKPVD
jgi:exosortase